VRNQVGIDWKLAQFMLDHLSGLKSGQAEHWTVLAATADAALVKGGGRAVLVDDPQRFSRVMRLAKIVALHPKPGDKQYGNPMPICEHPRGFWCIDADPLVMARALRLALLQTLSRFKLLSEQLDKEQVRLPKAEVFQAAATAGMMVPYTDVALVKVDAIIALLEAAGNGKP
jgi:hypothetical protein